MKLASKFLAISLLLVTTLPTAPASLIYLYDFPGNPGSGLATDQTNPQPSGATFGDFARTATLTQMPGAPANDTFGTENWNQTGSIDLTEFEGFSITAAPGYHLNLSSLTFDCTLKPSGPTNAEVGLFLNGSSTAYATFDFSPTPTTTTYTFNFGPLTDADNVTTATFKFYGWNAVATGGGIVLDNVATYGAIAVPESSALLPTLLLLGSLFALKVRQARRSRQAS